MNKKTMLTITRWVLILLFAGLAMYLMNYAMFAAWVSGGPPNKYPEAWAYMSLKSLCSGVSTILISVIAFLSIGKEITKRKKVVTVLLVLIACVLLSYPFAFKQLKIDSCLDSGGKWNEVEIKCIK